MELCVRETPRERKKAACESAMAVFRKGQNRLALLVAALACLTVSFVCYFIIWASSFIFYDLMGEQASLLVWFDLELFMLVLVWLLAMPLWLGMYRMAHSMIHGETMVIENFFAYISSASMYGRALGISFRLFVRWLPAWCGYLALRLFFDYDSVGVLLVIFMVITVILSVTLSVGLCGFVTVAVADDGLGLAKAKERAQGLLLGERMHVLCYDLLMLVRLVLSLIPVGVPFLLQTLPLSMLCAAAYQERLSAREM